MVNKKFPHICWEYYYSLSSKSSYAFDEVFGKHKFPSVTLGNYTTI